MSHFMKMFDGRFVGSWDLEGHDEVIVTIDDVIVVEIHNMETNKPENKPALSFVKGKKGLVLNKTNARAIAEIYGADTDKWKGKKIALYATTCRAFGKQVECVRIKRVGASSVDPDETGDPADFSDY